MNIGEGMNLTARTFSASNADSPNDANEIVARVFNEVREWIAAYKKTYPDKKCIVSSPLPSGQTVQVKSIGSNGKRLVRMEVIVGGEHCLYILSASQLQVLVLAYDPKAEQQADHSPEIGFHAFFGNKEHKVEP